MILNQVILQAFEFIKNLKIENYCLFLNRFYSLFFSEDIEKNIDHEILHKIQNNLNELEEIYSCCLEEIATFSEKKTNIGKCLLSIKNNVINYLVEVISYNTSGQIIYGKYLDNCIYIDKEQDNNLYNITMWNKDNNQEQQQFTFNSEKEVENFFRENDMIIKWEKLEE